MMEAAGLMRVSAGTLLLLLMCLFLPASSLLETTTQRPCPVGDFMTDANICCNKCPPGFKLLGECLAEGMRSNCTACPRGQFNDEMNFAPTCRKCRRCKGKHEVVESACERHQNAVCGCEEGFYRSKVDSVTFQCLRCTTCGPDEQEKQKCFQNRDTVCGCKENYYKHRGVCEPCKNCSTECKHHCSHTTLNTRVPDRTDLVPAVVGVAGAMFVLFILGVFITHMATKRFTKRKLRLSLSSQTADASPNSCQECLVYSEEPSETAVKAQICVMEQETSNLPDCVPLEIRIPELIYFVLDLVPVLQVKQLVRCLGVKDTDIEQAELDHRSCREAHYQMLRVWAERGSRAAGGGGTLLLPLPLLQELMDKLILMHLGRAAEELEAKYCTQ